MIKLIWFSAMIIRINHGYPFKIDMENRQDTISVLDSKTEDQEISSRALGYNFKTAVDVVKFGVELLNGLSAAEQAHIVGEGAKYLGDYANQILTNTSNNAGEKVAKLVTNMAIRTGKLLGRSVGGIGRATGGGVKLGSRVVGESVKVMGNVVDYGYNIGKSALGAAKTMKTYLGR